MVYCGKPSMGCTTCRERRIKCDETKPICRQCIKSRRHCSGYRSDFDILHRDETQATETRAKKAAAKKAAKRAAEFGGAFIQFEAVPAPAQRATQRATPPAVQALPAAVDAGGDSPSASTNSWTSPTSTALTTSSAFTSPLEVSFPVAAPSLPIDQHASHYFAAHFIMLPGEHGFKAGHLEYLVPLLQTETNSHGAFQLAYAACGLAAMSNREKADSTDLAHVAAMQHARACEAVARAIGDPVLRRSDATLAAVLLLIYFEKITASKEVGLVIWRSHIEGAMGLVKDWGEKIRQSKNSMKLFNAVRLQIIARTLSSGTAPSMGVNWWLREIEPDDLGARFQRFSLEISEIRAEVTKQMAILPRHGYGMDLMLEMLRKTQDLDRKIANYLDTLPAHCRYDTICFEDYVEGSLMHAPVFPGRVDRYQDLVTAATWNGMRAARIILGSLTIRVAAWICSPADYRLTPEYATAVRLININISDIISSVPFILSTYTKGQRAYHGVNAGSFLCGADAQAKMVGGLMASWPLSTVRCCDFSTDEQREWAIGRLNFIAHELGMKYANSLADSKIRFPSMLIRRDGLLPSQDPLKGIKATLPVRTAVR